MAGPLPSSPRGGCNARPEDLGAGQEAKFPLTQRARERAPGPTDQDQARPKRFRARRAFNTPACAGLNCRRCPRISTHGGPCDGLGVARGNDLHCSGLRLPLPGERPRFGEGLRAMSYWRDSFPRAGRSHSEWPRISSSSPARLPKLALRSSKAASLPSFTSNEAAPSPGAAL